MAFVFFFCFFTDPAITLSQFAITPDSQTALEGDSVIFRCKAQNNNDDLTYTWLLNGKCMLNFLTLLEFSSRKNEIVENVAAKTF